MSKGKTAKSSNVDATSRRDDAMPPGRLSRAPQRPGIDALLDAALEATFPASDPIALRVDR
jgi:hypothetical protein